MRDLRRWPGYAALNRPLTVLGVERRLFLLGATLALAVWNAPASLMAGGVVFAACYGAGWLAGRRIRPCRRCCGRRRDIRPGTIRASGRTSHGICASGWTRSESGRGTPGLRGGRFACRGAAVLGLAVRRPHLPCAFGRTDRGGPDPARRDGRPHAGTDRPGAGPVAAASVGARPRRAPLLPPSATAGVIGGEPRETRKDIAAGSERNRSAFLSRRVQARDAYVVWSQNPGLRPVAAGSRSGPVSRIARLWKRRRDKTTPTYLASEIEAATRMPPTSLRAFCGRSTRA